MTPEPKPTLYLVDDESDQLFLLRRAAERTGEFGEIRTALDSHLAYQELLDRAECGKPRPNLLITDWKMPRWSGAEFVCALSHHPQLKDIPVVALSSSYLNADREEAFSCGCRAFVQKPHSFHQLVDLMKCLAQDYCEARLEQ